MSKVIEVQMKDSLGLEVNQCLVLCKMAQNFKSDITLKHNQNEIDLKSILGLLSLCVAKGDMFTLTAKGEDASSAIDSIAKILA